MKMILTEKLEQLLLATWASFINKSQFLKTVLEHARNTEYPVSRQVEIPPRQIKMILTKFRPEGQTFSVWVEFTVPKDEGVVVGTHVYSLTLNGELALVETFGTYLCQSVKPHQTGE